MGSESLGAVVTSFGGDNCVRCRDPERVAALLPDGPVLPYDGGDASEV